MSYIRVNKLLRVANLTVEQLAELMGVDHVNPNQKLGFLDNVDKESVVVHTDMDSDTLIALRNAINAELDSRLSEIRADYLEFKNKVKG